ncbi:PREDICTED: LOW QUALITY PROTEIN: peroxisomal membrane protein 2 [Gekko japonicus]|uniref:LOW QUALITY PROTEIN: peroxisomal membrane protein 2 n=1 Tax=Gekko japonicus TaxID=146911 RepID=A0ABM1L3T4_GEKJA|nr:PREDICTED: LOW QUALITY PROTEIN: peroxisomal membrane protein 2 [Gekko japonicus]
MSPVFSKPESGPLPQKLLARYLLLLRLYPVLTKAVSSALLSALSLLSQIIEKSRKKKGPSRSFDLGEPLRFATYGQVLLLHAATLVLTLQMVTVDEVWPFAKVILNRLLWQPAEFFLSLFSVFFSPQFRVLFGNLVALFWFAYLASVKK